MFYKLIQKNEVKYIILFLNFIFIYINYKMNFKKIEFFYKKKNLIIALIMDYLFMTMYIVL